MSFLHESRSEMINCLQRHLSSSFKSLYLILQIFLLHWSEIVLYSVAPSITRRYHSSEVTNFILISLCAFSWWISKITRRHPTACEQNWILNLHIVWSHNETGEMQLIFWRQIYTAIRKASCCPSFHLLLLNQICLELTLTACLTHQQSPPQNTSPWC